MTRTARRVALSALVVATLVAVCPAAAAQEAQPPAAPASEPPITQAPLPPAQDGFVPVRPGELQQEQLPAAPLVFVAYSVVWLALLLYVFLLWRRLAGIERDLREVTAKLPASPRT
jgi:CcmD family protein